MNYWLRAFSGRSWQAFLASDRRVLAFRDKYRQRARNVQAGDVFLCYLLRIKRWVGFLEVADPAHPADAGGDYEASWTVRFRAKPLTQLSPEHGVPMDSLEGALSFYKSGDKPSRWIAHVRRTFTR